MVEDSFPFVYPLPDFLLTLLGLVLFVVDVALDIRLVEDLYSEGAYLKTGILLFIFLASTVIIQLFSGLLYYYDWKNRNAGRELLIRGKWSLTAAHLALLAVPLRYANILKISIKSFHGENSLLEGEAVYQNHDLSLLRLFETFLESAPQLVFMIFIIIQKKQVDFITSLKTAGSVASIALSVAMYHRCMRSFLPEKSNQGYVSSLVYFLWNLLLIGPRVFAVALFTCANPCYIAGHYLILWAVLVFWAWRQDKDFMDNLVGEWLYRCTVGQIWYFSWFNLTVGSTLWRGIIYHSIMLVDMGILLGFWWHQQEYLEDIFKVEPYVILGIIFSLYILGLVLKVLYYRCFHPKVTELPPEEPEVPLRDEVDFHLLDVAQAAEAAERPKQEKLVINKRMRNLAANFYSSPATTH
ncbi:XK-related protein 8-like [Brienomyrus brachyistius]|uniref:XK-related protein 8-like n=1 Tax=Brienomyrus brachyistius TaxID=42636 RepID=UPI0020B27FD2|nr:XK-related protein 8-like [Brienomyrus brachyistius]